MTSGGHWLRFAISSSRGLPNLNDHRKPTRVEYCDDEQIVFKFASPILNSQHLTLSNCRNIDTCPLSSPLSRVCVCLLFCLFVFIIIMKCPLSSTLHPPNSTTRRGIPRPLLLPCLVSCCVRSYKLLAPSRSQPQPGQPQQQLPCVIKQIQKYLATSIHSNGVSRGETFLDTLLGRWVWPSDAA